MALNKMTGIVKIIGETKTFSSGFKKREVVIEEIDEKAKKPNVVPFEFSGKSLPTVDTLSVGRKVTVEYFVRGSEWNGRHFVNLSAYRVTMDASAPANVPPPAEPPESAPDASSVDDMPF